MSTYGDKIVSVEPCFAHDIEDCERDADSELLIRRDDKENVKSEL